MTPKSDAKVSDSDLDPHNMGNQRIIDNSPFRCQAWDFGNEQVDMKWDRLTYSNHFWRAYITDKSGKPAQR